MRLYLNNSNYGSLKYLILRLNPHSPPQISLRLNPSSRSVSPLTEFANYYAREVELRALIAPLLKAIRDLPEAFLRSVALLA